VVGDQFVFQSELFFDRGSAVLRREGRVEFDQLATALLDLDTRIPAEISWVLRVDGHTDIQPVAVSQYKSNWELSAARAISVVQYLISKASRRSGWLRQWGGRIAGRSSPPCGPTSMSRSRASRSASSA
jgi:flagellar motor protein MotB